MEWTEQKSNMAHVHSAVLQRLRELFSQGDSQAEQFTSPAGVPFSVCKMGETAPWNFLVIEYHDTGEDGESFYPEDYQSLDDLVADMTTEILSATPEA